jgi:pyruvate/2-oxoglutarate dehydrogenase complex dihydrolipoamide dehydrogenase (E3) component
MTSYDYVVVGAGSAGHRQTTADADLRPALGRQNLTVELGAVAEKAADLITQAPPDPLFTARSRNRYA